MTFTIPEPQLQVSFARALAGIREAMLQDALRKTVGALDIPTVDKELAEIVPVHSLGTFASMYCAASYVRGAYGDCREPPFGRYYRLLDGYSQKEFHKAGVGSMYKAASISGKLSKPSADALPEFCRAMAQAGALLLAGISTDKVSAAILDDLTLLTLGPQLRGGANVAIGSAAIAAVFGVVKEIVAKSIETSTPERMTLKNAAGRIVLIEFAADPDIIIREQLKSGAYRHVIAIEVKGGRDFSNVHNRIGEAEKSHQKARANGYTECWTVVNVDRIDMKMAKRESPSTDRFYRISDLLASSGNEFAYFRDRVISLTGIK